MGLFDFLKPKNNAKEDFANKPAVRNAIVGMELEYLQKQIANLCAVGREDDAKKAVTDFVSKYGQESAGEVCPPKELAQLCYAASYMDLPDLVLNRWTEFQQLWSSKLPFAVHLAITAATRMKKRLSTDQLYQFKSMQGSIGEDIDCFVIQFPTPPPQEGELDMDAITAILEGKGAGMTPPVLAPYFAVASHRPNTDERWLHVLGQSPGSGTTIRVVMGAGSSGNCGPGPDPSSPEDFLRAIKRLIE